MLPVLWMWHYNDQLRLEKAYSNRTMHHSFIWCAYGTWRSPNLITGKAAKNGTNWDLVVVYFSSVKMIDGANIVRIIHILIYLSI